MRIPVSVDTASRESTEFFCLAGALTGAALVALVVLALRSSGLLQGIDFALYDLALRTQPHVDEMAPEIVLVRISEEDLQALPAWPLDDATLATIIDRVASHAPAAIGVDLFRDHPVGRGQEALARALLENSQTVVVHYIASAAQRTAVRAPEVLGDRPAQRGFANIIVDPGGVVRRALLFMGDDAGQIHSSFALQLALKRLARDGVTPVPDPREPSFIRLGQVTVESFTRHDGAYVNADDGEYQYLIDYHRAPSGFDSITLSDLLSDAPQASDMEGKIVLIGVTAQSVKDSFDTPFSRSFHGPEGPMFGLELQALLTTQLLRMGLLGQEPLHVMPEWAEIAVLFVSALLGAVLGWRSQGVLRVVGASIAAPLLLAWSTVVFQRMGWWMPGASPAIAWALACVTALSIVAAVQKRQRDRIFSLFSRFCSAEVVDEIWRHRDDILGVGRTTPLVATVMFTDIVSFTATAQKLGPHRLMAWLDDYVQDMSPIVYRHGGIIVRLVGDAFMIVFGAPVPRHDAQAIAEDAKRAVRTALEMNSHLAALNARAHRPAERIAVRIGIASGDVVAGVLGDARRQEYNLHGDCVNIAARIEQLDKSSFQPDYLNMPSRVLLTAATQRLLDDEFDLIEYGALELKGLEGRTTIYQLQLAPATPT